MPLGINIRDRNRSQQALENSLNQAQRGPPVNPVSAPIVPSDEDKVYDPRNSLPPLPPSYAQPHGDGNAYIPANINQGSDNRAYQESAERPARSQSHRHTAGYPPIQPPSAVSDLRGGTVDDQALGDYGRQYIPAPNSKPQPPVPAVEQKKSKSSRFFGSFSSKGKGTTEQTSLSEPPSSHNNLGGIGRRISIRHKDPPPGLPQAQTFPSDKQAQLPGWQSGQSSESQLESPHEADEEHTGVDRYIIHPSDQDLDRTPEPGSHQLPNPTIRLGGADPDPTVRLVDQVWQRQYPQPPQIQTHEQWIAQQNQQVASSPVPISPVAHQQNDYQPPNPQPGQYQTYTSPSNQANPNHQFRSNTNPEVVSQLSHDSPVEAIEDQRPVSVQSNTQTPISAGNYPSHLQTDYPARSTSIQAAPQGPRPLATQSTMPPPQQPLQGRRSTDAKNALQQEGRNGPPPGYSQPGFPGSGQGQNSGSANPASGTQQSGTYRGSSLQREYSQASGTGEQGRSTPPLPGDRDRELTEMDKLVIKYKKVKGLYFEKLGQVEQLQNTLANQRLSQSRTSLDDNEYATRFNRLDGAIKEIAFSIRKDWKTIPLWLVPYVNQDAQKTGTKEMTAVGRAAISRWIADEIFFKCFHPGLEIGLSSELKRIEQNIRFFASPVTSQEESEALTSKVVQWRLATVEGLGYMLNSPESLESKALFTQKAVTNLTAHLLQHLQDPAPQGIEGNATSIIELAVGIASHLPLESRDISITYPMPSDPLQPTFKVEAPLPALEHPGVDLSADTEAGSNQSDGKDQTTDADSRKAETTGNKVTKQKPEKKDMPLVAQNSVSGKKMSISAAGGAEPSQEKSKDRGDGNQKVRFAGFVGVEVRGRQWLVNPPVWTVS